MIPGRDTNSIMHSVHRWVSDMETVIIPGKISKIPPQVPAIGRGKTP
ncbi:hypothetical protein E2C01_055237 [Portunus trituberculatus]|uniref:Uncharacterized protein n=1 Tax=Portunus trituberculatus TaxID=210409 RepID=A0A5B7GX45_PORTR|nr:hypothetical protein [Portunus trituberculatus]